MFLAYTAMALFIVLGVVAIFTVAPHIDKKHEWVPTRAVEIIGGMALILTVLAGSWFTLRNLAP